MENSYQRDDIVQILEAIINELPHDGEADSIIAAILLSILEGTPYEGESPKSVIGKLLLRLKDKIEGRDPEPYEDPAISNIAKILLSIINETEYPDPPKSNVAELLLELKEKLETLIEITVSGAVANFTTNVAKPLVKLISDINAYQEGSGDPSPVNVRPIHGYSSVTISHSGADTSDADTVTIALGDTIYGGTLDVTTGKLRATHKSIILDENSGNWQFQAPFQQGYLSNILQDAPAKYESRTVSHLCDILKPVANYRRGDNLGNFSSLISSGSGVGLSCAATNLEDFITWITNNHVTFIYELETPIEIDLEGKEIVTYNGVNNIWSNTGDVSVTYLYKEDT